MIEQYRDDPAPGRIAGIGGCAEVPGHRLAGEVGVQFHQPQVAVGRAVERRKCVETTPIRRSA